MKTSVLFGIVSLAALCALPPAGEAAAQAATQAATKTKIYVSIAKTDDRFIDILREAITKAGNADPDVDLTVAIANNDGPTQLGQVRDAIAAHAGAVILLGVDGKTEIAAGDMAAKGKTPLVFLNRRPPQDQFNGPVSIVSSNDLVAGRLQMRLIADKLHGAGNVVILRGEEGHPAAIERTEGVKEILAKQPGIHLVQEATGNWKRDQGEQLITQWLASGQHIDAILCNNDEMAMGAISALKKANIPAGKVLVAGVDGTPDALDAIRSGYLTLSLLQNAKAQGEQSLVDAKKFADKQYADVYDWVPYELILPSNVEQYAKAN